VKLYAFLNFEGNSVVLRLYQAHKYTHFK